MQRFYFDLQSGKSDLQDHDGVDLLNETIAKEYAVTSARSIIAADVLAGVLNLDQKISVLNSDRQPLATIDFADVISVSRRDEAMIALQQQPAH